PAVRAHIERGDGRNGSVTFAQAAEQYVVAADIARQEGHLPSLSMWRLANTWFHDGQLNRAARVLDQLADEAARAGDLPVQALALYYAAWVNGQDRKSTRLNSSHVSSSYAVFCLKKKIDRPFQRA